MAAVLTAGLVAVNAFLMKSTCGLILSLEKKIEEQKSQQNLKMHTLQSAGDEYC